MRQDESRSCVFSRQKGGEADGSEDDAPDIRKRRSGPLREPTARAGFHPPRPLSNPRPFAAPRTVSHPSAAQAVEEASAARPSRGRAGLPPSVFRSRQREREESGGNGSPAFSGKALERGANETAREAQQAGIRRTPEGEANERKPVGEIRTSLRGAFPFVVFAVVRRVPPPRLVPTFPIHF